VSARPVSFATVELHHHPRHDLDLRNTNDQRTLKVRVRHASKHVCREAGGPIPEIGFGAGRDGSLTCADLTYNDAKPQINAAIDSAKRGQQPAMALVMSAPTKVR
jgi:UrcA family protein